MKILYFNGQLLEYFSHPVFAAMVGALLGAILTYIVTSLRVRKYRKTFMFKYKLKLLELPTYLEVSTYLEDPTGQESMSANLRGQEKRVLNEMQKFLKIIEEIYDDNRVIYLKDSDLKNLDRLYQYVVNLIVHISINGVNDLDYDNPENDVYLDFSKELYSIINNLPGPDKNIAFHAGLEMEI